MGGMIPLCALSQTVSWIDWSELFRQDIWDHSDHFLCECIMVLFYLKKKKKKDWCLLDAKLRREVLKFARLHLDLQNICKL